MPTSVPSADGEQHDVEDVGRGGRAAAASGSGLGEGDDAEPGDPPRPRRRRPAATSERPHPRHASAAVSYIRTVSRSAASRKATAKPAVAIARTSATSSTVWWATAPQAAGVDAARSRRTAMHCPLPIRRCDRPRVGGARRRGAVDERRQQRRVQPAQPGGRAVEAAADGEQVEAVGDASGRRAPRAGPATGACRRRGTRPTSPLAASSPCCSAHALPTHPAGSGSPVDDRGPGRRGDVGGAVGRLVVDDDHLGDARRADDRRQQRPDPRRLVARRHDDGDRRSRCRRRTRPAGSRRAARATLRDDGRARRAAATSTTARPRRHARPGRRRCARWSATSGSPPPGWLEPPTRYSPRRAPRLPGRRNAARRPFDDVP